VAHPARIYDYWLGGKDNFAADRIAAEEVLTVMPAMAQVARSVRMFLAAVVHHLAADAGIRQFLDIGTGLPTADNTHEVAQRLAPESRIVYVDNDPLVLAHARILLTSSREGITNYIDADMHDPAYILAEAAKILDLSRPVALLLIGVLGHVADHGEARTIVRQLLAGLPAGSFLVQCDGTDTDLDYVAALERYRDSGGVPYNVRSHEQIESLYDGLDPVEPGVVQITRWRPEVNAFGEAADVAELGGVARKR
jgi:hypothetical protein